MNRVHLISIRKLIWIALICSNTLFCKSQTVQIAGVITDIESTSPLELVLVYIEGTNFVAYSDELGKYELEFELKKNTELVVSRIGFKEVRIKVDKKILSKNDSINIQLAPAYSDLKVVITEHKEDQTGIITEDVKNFEKIPNASGNVESILSSIALGTSSGTGGELSAQYNVRGGNYDENLIYINDFEIFRPQLISTGQQEGLSFPNIDLINDLSFSSGGFQAKYGDKLSSVLDIKYKRPKDKKASVELSLLGGKMHLEGSHDVDNVNNKKFRYLFGARYKTTRYLLSSLDTKGEYLPDFVDIQTYLTYDLTNNLQIAYLANYNNSKYSFAPEERTTTIGNLGFHNQALQFSSLFEGIEKDQFVNFTNGLSVNYISNQIKNSFFIKLIASQYLSREEENLDIIGYYRLSEIETGLGNDNFGQEIAVLGAGAQHNYRRNYLLNTISTIGLKSGLEISNSKNNDRTISNIIEWGVKYQYEKFSDRINEWERLDSAGYTLPLSKENLQLSAHLKSENELHATKINGYFQNTYRLKSQQYNVKLNGGIRISYSDRNNELLFSPRFQILLKPKFGKKDITYKISGGLYYQQPFYREMRDDIGNINLQLMSQKSTHFVAGFIRRFYWKKVSDKPFKIITELYYKKLHNIISYEIDNVRIRYSGFNNASGYVVGLDLRINGEFVPGAESWINLSLLSARETIHEVQHLRPNVDNPAMPLQVKYVPRPSDQFMTMAIFFQDYLPKNDRCKVFLNMTIGTGLPFGIKDLNTEYRNVFRYKAYQRVDIGFSYQLWKKSWRKQNPRSPLRFSNSTWLSLEVFNLMQVGNVSNNTWIKTIDNTQYAIPNYLTSRRVNMRLKFDF